nr:DUF6615 family protein [Novosphingobium umbonatum]
MLMAALIGLEPYGVKVDFPINEALTGDDMDWEFVDLNPNSKGRYFRLHIQAKRAKEIKLKKSSYWVYNEIDHGLTFGNSPPANVKPNVKYYGAQHYKLVNEAKKINNCAALYMFYNPKSSLTSNNCTVPSVDGINWMFADLIKENLNVTRWPVNDRKVETLRPHFQPLHKLLCFNNNGGKNFPRRPPPWLPRPDDITKLLNSQREDSDDRIYSSEENIPHELMESIKNPNEYTRELGRKTVTFITDYRKWTKEPSFSTTP